MLYFYEVHAEFSRPHSTRQLDVVRLVEETVGVLAKTWSFPEHDRFRILFLFEGREGADKAVKALSNSADCYNHGLRSAHARSRATDFSSEPFPFRIGSGVRVKTELALDSQWFIKKYSGQKARVVGHDGYPYSMIVFDGDLHQEAVSCWNGLLDPDTPNQVTIE